jgi:hypothetical protein
MFENVFSGRFGTVKTGWNTETVRKNHFSIFGPLWAKERSWTRKNPGVEMVIFDFFMNFSKFGPKMATKTWEIVFFR